jgi:hypothetical protein
MKPKKTHKSNKPSTAVTPKPKGKKPFGKVNDGAKRDLGKSEQDMSPRVGEKMARKKRLEGKKL